MTAISGRLTAAVVLAVALLACGDDDTNGASGDVCEVAAELEAAFPEPPSDGNWNNRDFRTSMEKSAEFHRAIGALADESVQGDFELVASWFGAVAERVPVDGEYPPSLEIYDVDGFDDAELSMASDEVEQWYDSRCPGVGSLELGPTGSGG